MCFHFSKKNKLINWNIINIVKYDFRKVFESDLLVTGEHCMTHYRDCKDIGSYICGDKIVDIAAIQLQNVCIFIIFGDDAIFSRIEI